MGTITKILCLFFCLLSFLLKVPAQECENLNVEWKADIPSICGEIVMTMLHDRGGRPYLYIANKEAGLVIYNIEQPANPVFVTDIPQSQMDGLDVMNLSQNGNFLYLAIGNFFSGTQKAGMAIVDVSDPTQPGLTDIFTLEGSKGGAGIVEAEGDYAYLGAMEDGLIILSIEDKYNIQFVSQFVPDINYPAPNPTSSFYNARGLTVKDDIVYLAYDAGALRIINCVDKNNPRETGRFSNPVLHIPFNLPRAYNNVVLNDTLLYMAVDYCGMEILNIADTSNIQLVGWWNPSGCPNATWAGNPFHANELHYEPTSNLLFFSVGKSEMQVLDVSDPANPKECESFGDVDNNIATWGIDVFDEHIFLSYICALQIPFITPFGSNWTGVKVLSYDAMATNVRPELFSEKMITLYPVPTRDILAIESQENFKNIQNLKIEVQDIHGRSYRIPFSIQNGNKIEADVSRLGKHVYFLRMKYGEGSLIRKFLK